MLSQSSERWMLCLERLIAKMSATRHKKTVIVRLGFFYKTHQLYILALTSSGRRYSIQIVCQKQPMKIKLLKVYNMGVSKIKLTYSELGN